LLLPSSSKRAQLRKLIVKNNDQEEKLDEPIENSDHEEKLDEPIENSDHEDQRLELFPPLSLGSILRYAWSMTLALSSQEEQRDIYKDLRIMKDSENATSYNFLLGLAGDDKKAKSYLSEVFFTVTSFLRTYGLEREVYLDNLKSAKNLWEIQTGYYLSLSKIQLESNSEEYNDEGEGESVEAKGGRALFNSTTSKIISFAGGGSAGLGILIGFFRDNISLFNPAVNQDDTNRISQITNQLEASSDTLSQIGNLSNSINSMVASSDSQLLEQINRQIEILSNSSNINSDTILEVERNLTNLLSSGQKESFNLLSNLSDNYSSLTANVTEIGKSTDALREAITNASSSSDSLFILLSGFLAAGAIGYYLYNYFANKYAYRKIKQINEENNKMYEKFWEEKMRPNLLDIFTNLAIDIRKTMKKYYGDIPDDSLPSEDLGKEELKLYISKHILPSEDAYCYKSTIL